MKRAGKNEVTYAARVDSNAKNQTLLTGRTGPEKATLAGRNISVPEDVSLSPPSAVRINMSSC